MIVVLRLFCLQHMYFLCQISWHWSLNLFCKLFKHKRELRSQLIKYSVILYFAPLNYSTVLVFCLYLSVDFYLFMYNTSSGAHLASYPMGTRGSFPRG